MHIRLVSAAALTLLVTGAGIASAAPGDGLAPAQRAHGGAVEVSTPPTGTPRYTLVDLGTFGGPHADVTGPAEQISDRGVVLGLADTPVADEDSPNDGLGGDDPFIFHAFAWRDGHLDDLGALPGNNSSVSFEMTRRGLGVGVSETGGIDPRTGVSAVHPVLFLRGRVVDLGTLPGGSEGFALAVNEDNTVVGPSNTGARGPGMPLFFDWTTQIHSFIWHDGRMRDLGTLGGPGTLVATINDRGQVSGDSYVDATVNPTTGFPTLHPFLWQHGRMRDLGSLGGTLSFTLWMNQRGEVVGKATTPGDTIIHPFLWDGTRLRDLGTLGGDYGEATRVNDRGEVAGWASPASNDTIHTYLWRRGTMTDLTDPAGPDCTYPEGMNNRTQIVGNDCDTSMALLWQNGSQYDLNDLVDATEAVLTSATYVDDHGRIVALGLLPNGDQHVFLLTPASRP